MRIRRIALRNWMCFRGEHVLDLPAGPIAVVGANWSGKTALLEAIEWALDGRHRKPVDDGVITYGESDVAVTLHLDDEVSITRSRERGKPTRVSVNDVVALADEEIEHVLGMSVDELRATSHVPQSDVEGMVGVKSARRREIVGSWLELDAWKDRHEKAKRQREVAQVSLARIGQPGPAPRDLAAIEADLAMASTALREAGEARELAQKKLEDAAALDRAVKAHIDYEEACDAAKALKDQIRAVPATPPADVAAAKTELDEARVAYREASSACAVATALGRGEFDGTCPVVGIACPAVDVVRGATAEIAARIDETSKAEAAAAQRNQRARERDRLVSESQVRRDGLVARFNAAVERARVLKERLEPDLEEAARLGSGPTTADASTALRIASQAAEGAAADHARLHEELVAARRWREDVERRGAESDALSAEVAALLLVERAFAPAGIPAKIAADRMVDLEHRGNALLAGTGLSFRFAWDRELRDPATSCDQCGYTYRGVKDKECPGCGAVRGKKRSDELDVLVDDGSGELEDVSRKSGGARVLVAMAIRLAGGLMVRERRGSRVAWAVVDEPFGPLDRERRPELVRVFGSMLGAVGLEQALVVSHDVALAELMPAAVVVRRAGKYSTLEVRS